MHDLSIKVPNLLNVRISVCFHVYLLSILRSSSLNNQDICEVFLHGTLTLEQHRQHDICFRSMLLGGFHQMKVCGR